MLNCCVFSLDVGELESFVLCCVVVGDAGEMLVCWRFSWKRDVGAVVGVVVVCSGDLLRVCVCEFKFLLLV